MFDPFDHFNLTLFKYLPEWSNESREKTGSFLEKKNVANVEGRTLCYMNIARYSRYSS